MPVEKLREKIDKVDSKIVALLEERLDLARKIGAVKRKKNLQIEDSERERQVLGKVTKDTKLNKAFVRGLFEDIIKYCKQHE
jgi:monofunctional chorismate mutase